MNRFLFTFSYIEKSESKNNQKATQIDNQEKVKLIEENEAIVDFVSQDVSSSTTTAFQAGENFQIEVGEEDENDILIPDEHPEHFTSLDELQERAEGI